MKIRSIILSFFLLFGMSEVAAASTPTITNLTPSGASVGRYEKYEGTFSLSKTYPAGSFLPYYYFDPSDTPSVYPGRNSPYGVDGITIDVHIMTPSGKSQLLPAFYHESYTRSGSTLTGSSSFSWKFRYAPMELGKHEYYLTVTDKEGATRYPASGTLSFTSNPSNSKGFIRVSSRDSRFFEFDNGESYIPNSSGRQWWRSSRTPYYEQWFTEFAKYGINLTRIWDQNDGYGLTVEGPYDMYVWPEGWGLANKDAEAMKIPKGTQMNQRGNFEEDIILSSAEKNGVYIELCAHGDPFWIWDASVSSEGWNPTPRKFDDPEHLNYWKRNYRYRIARWSYSTAILSFETWNEHGHVPVPSNASRFYESLSAFMRTQDPHRHLITTSQGSQNWSPAFWSLPAFDIANYHDYMMPGRFPDSLVYDAAHFVYLIGQCLRTDGSVNCGIGLGDRSRWSGNQKPYIWGELDSGTSQWNQANINAKATHDMRWAGLFSPIGTTGIDWYWDQQSADFVLKKHQDAKIVSDFFKDVDYAGARFTYLSTADVKLTSELLSPSNSNLRVLAMRGADGTQAYAYLQNKNAVMWNGPASSAAISGTFDLPGMKNGTYTVQTWNTTTGQTTQTTRSTSTGILSVPVSGLTADQAIKIRSTNFTSPTLVPTPTPAPSCPGDINLDRVVNLTDYTLFLSDFLKTPFTHPGSDLTGDGVVNSSDYLRFLPRFLKPC